MKHRNNRLFWSAAGARLLGYAEPTGITALPEPMLEALESLPPLPGMCHSISGPGLSGRKGRHVYQETWNILRDLGFQRPLRLTVFQGIDLLVPFFRGRMAVSPQGFRDRVPLELRSLALVGKSAVLRSHGVHLVVCSADHVPQVWETLNRGKCSVCTPETLPQMVNTLDFSPGIHQI